MLSGKTAIVTGGSRGIGRAIALALCESCEEVAIFFAGNQAAADETVSLADKMGRKIIAVKCDVSSSDEVKAAVDTVSSRWGRVDILVNCAGITRDGLLMRMKDEDFSAVISTNLTGAFYMTRQCSALMMKKRCGRIVNISSVSGINGNMGQANYSSAKAGLIGLTKSTAKELASRGITCNAIAPGFIETDMTAALPEKVREAAVESIPAKKMGAPEDIAALAAFLCSDAASYITGEVIRVDGGLAM